MSDHLDAIDRRLAELERTVSSLERIVDVSREEIARLETAIAMLRRHVGRGTIRPPVANELTSAATHLEGAHASIDRAQESLEQLVNRVLSQKEGDGER